MTDIAQFAADVPPDDVAFAQRYLERFGGLSDDTPAVAEAIMQTQRVLRVDVDGAIGPQTVKAMRSAPRCGLPDHIHRLGGGASAWDRTLATGQGIAYTIQRYTVGLARSDQDDLLEMAFGQWTDVSGIKFRRVKHSREANILVGASGSAREHFGEPFVTLAWSELPPSGSFAGQLTMKFDDAERWMRDGSGDRGILYLNVACHEIGHAIGLDHDSNLDHVALMDPMYAPEVSRPLPGYDINQAQDRYGEPEQIPAPDGGSDYLPRKEFADGLRDLAMRIHPGD